MRSVDSRIDYNIEEMIHLWRNEGWSFSALARRYNRDHTTILSQIRRQVPDEYLEWHNKRTTKKLKPKDKRIKVRLFGADSGLNHHPDPEIVEAQREHLLDAEGPINYGKSYKEYVAESLTRAAERHYKGLFGDALHENAPVTITVKSEDIPEKFF